MVSQRDKSIDIAKGLGMIMVVFGHTQSEYTQFVYQFHLPLFFFLSGIVFNEKKVENVQKFILSKAKALWLPFIKYEIIFLLLHNLFSSIGLYSTVSGNKLFYSLSDFAKNFGLILIMGFGEKLAGPLWFLIATLEIVIFFAILVYASKKLNLSLLQKNMILLVIAVAGFVTGSLTHLPRMGSQALIGFFFFSIGFLFKSKKDFIPYTWWLALISLALVFICYKINFVDISKLSFTFKPLLIISGIAGCYFSMYLSKHIPRAIATPIEYCGKNTISVLALHCISFKLVLLLEIFVYELDWSYLGYFPTYDVNVLWTLLFTIVGVTIPLLLSWSMDRIKTKCRCFHEKKIH